MAVGSLCEAAETADAVDAHLALLVMTGDVVATSDVDDIRRLLAARKVRAQVQPC